MSQFIAILLGAVIGILTVYLTSRHREREWRKENILRPIYNELEEIISTNAKNLSIGYRSKWETLDSYSRFRVSQKLRKHLDQFSTEISKWNDLVFAQATLTKETAIILANKLKEILPQSLIFQEGGKNCLLLESLSGEKTFIELEKWAEMFGLVILSGKKGYELYQALNNYSKAKSMGHERFFSSWYFEYPQLFEILSDVANVKISGELYEATDDMDEKTKIILVEALKLREELEREIKKIL